MARLKVCFVVFFFFKQKTAYEIVSRDWSSDVCSSDLKKFSFSKIVEIHLKVTIEKVKK